MNRQFEKHISMPTAWAFSIGTSIGWGSLVVTCSTYLAQSGPAGSVAGLILGSLVMLVIGWNYVYMMKCYPEAGGAYAFTREVFGHDHGFLAAWFLAMTYLAVLWANATALPLFGRIFSGGFFMVGRLYTVFGYDVYIGEAVLSLLAIVLTGVLCMTQKRITDVLMLILAAVFTAGIVICFVSSVFGNRSGMSPHFVADTSALSQIIRIAVISPWAFIGFESISHGSEEFSFDKNKTARIIMISVVSTMALYVMITLLSVSAYPDRYGSWFEYIRDLDRLEGIEALPSFYAAQRYMGDAGVLILMASLLALVITSLIGNVFALSRLFYALGKDGILPRKVSQLNRKGIPAYAVMLVVAISAFIPFVGRTAIGWIVDVTTIGATLIYGLVSASVIRMAKEMKDKREKWTGIIGLAAMILFAAYILIPNIASKGTMASETYMLFLVWTVLGFVFFRSILRSDRERRFGNSIIVWVVMLSLVLFIAMIWMRQSMISSDETMKTIVESHYEQESVLDAKQEIRYIEEQIEDRQRSNTWTMLLAVGLFSFALLIMLTNHYYLDRRSRESEQMANTDSMTGVKNKYAFTQKERVINESIKSGIVSEFAVVVCDVNGLKKINDTLGHKAGDEYICAASRMVSEIFRHGTIYRIGGDEFATVLTGRDYTIRKELIRLLHDTSVKNIKSGGVVVSGGISSFVFGEDKDFHSVFERADSLMYEEKKLLKSLGAAVRDDERSASDAPGDDGTGAAQDQAGIPADDLVISIRKHVLVVDDKEVNQVILGNILSDDYDIMYASDGVDAWAALQEHREEVALVLLDLVMPRMSGNELLAKMKADADLQMIPVIIFTSDQRSEVECLQMGAADFIPKPYPSPEIIKARVSKCIELTEDRNIIRSTERDSLTDLFNKEYFVRYVGMLDRYYADTDMDALVVNVNRFHMINERYGKQYGDTILKRLGERVRQITRRLEGVCCRQGADTFLIYAPHRNDYSDIPDILAHELDDEDEGPARTRLRMGVYYKADKSLDIERRFDRAMIAADSVRGNYTRSIGIYDAGLHESAIFNERLIEEFESNLANRDFCVYFQPKYDIRRDKPVLTSAEALVRWKHPELDMINPGVFIPLLEDNGMIFSLDRYVWEETARNLREWKDKYGVSVPISVNVSRIDMLIPGLKDILAGILEENGITTDDIILEITESAYTTNSEQVIQTVNDLRGMGFRIEMDDFGTGYSSLGMLSRLPIDVLKLDMSFVKSAFDGNRDLRMIELIIDIADYLGVPVIAEGVETGEQCMALKAMGCDVIQGYYFSKPRSREDFEALLTAKGSERETVVREAGKSYLSISKALSLNYESIFYIDPSTDEYLKFYPGENGELHIGTYEEGFSRKGAAELLADADKADAEKLRAVLSKDRLTELAAGKDMTVITYNRLIDGRVRPYSIETVTTRNKDERHVVLGLVPVQQ